LRLPKKITLKGRNLIGPYLRSIRTTHRPKITLEDLSGRLAALGLYLDRTTLGRIERQERSAFDYEVVFLARALRTSPLRLLGLD
jgi:hypothetical protein